MWVWRYFLLDSDQLLFLIIYQSLYFKVFFFKSLSLCLSLLRVVNLHAKFFHLQRFFCLVELSGALTRIAKLRRLWKLILWIKLLGNIFWGHFFAFFSLFIDLRNFHKLWEWICVGFSTLFWLAIVASNLSD